MFKLSTRTSLVVLTAMAFAFVSSPAFALSGSYEEDLDWLGYVPDGGSLTYEHFFAPAVDPNISISSIDSAWLEVTVVDDWNCSRLGSCWADWANEAETASIDLNSVSWQSGSATLNVFFGDVTAQANLLNNAGVLTVTVDSDGGDFYVLSSDLDTKYTYTRNGVGGAGSGGGVNPMPEPSAALVFGLGALLVQRRVRKGVLSR